MKRFWGSMFGFLGCLFALCACAPAPVAAAVGAPASSGLVDSLISVIQGTITPVLTAVVLAMLGMLFAWLGKKAHIEVRQADKDYLESVAIRAIAFAEEEGAAFLKAHGNALPSNSKRMDAITYLLRMVPALSQQEATDFIDGMLGKVKGAGATGDKAVSQAGFVRLRTLLVMMAIVAVLVLSSCASQQMKANTVAGYDATGQILTDIETQAKSMCDAGKINPVNCAVLKTDYSKARDAYITSGDALIVALDAQDAATQKTNLAAYQAAITDLGTLLPALINTAAEFGIQTSLAPAGVINGGAK